MITAKDVNQAFDNLETAFNELAAIEDEKTRLTNELAEAKEGGMRALQIKQESQEVQRKNDAAFRAYKIAGMKADRIRMLLDVQKTAMGRD